MSQLARKQLYVARRNIWNEKSLLTLSPEKPRENFEAISTIVSCLFMETYITLPLHSAKLCKNSETIAQVVNVISYVLFPSLLILLYTMYRKIQM